MVGQTVDISFEETINHPGWFRLAIALENDQNFDRHILDDNIPHKNSPPTPRPYDISITVPDLPCEGCTLQLIQVMTDSPLGGGRYEEYFSCADIRIVGGGGGTSATTSSGASATTAGGGGGSTTSSSGGGSGPMGCQNSRVDGWAVLAGFAAMLARFRRRR